MKNKNNFVRGTWCTQLYPAVPHQLGSFSEYGMFMCLPCGEKYKSFG